MKKTLSALLSVAIAACACTVFPFSASSAETLSSSQFSAGSYVSAQADMSKMTAKEFMTAMKDDLKTDVPGNVKLGGVQ